MEPFDLAGPGGGARRGIPRKCLLGTTIMVVEDSRSASDALQRLGASLGARMRRADTMEAAERHLASYRPNVVIVDLGLPDASGLSLLKSLADAAPPRPGLVATSGDDPDLWVGPATEAGAGAVLPKPIGVSVVGGDAQGLPAVTAFAEAMLAVLPDGESRRAGFNPRPLDRRDEGEGRAAALAADLAQLRSRLAQALAERDDTALAYCAQFLRSLVRQTEDADLARLAAPFLETDGADRHRAATELTENLPLKAAG